MTALKKMEDDVSSQVLQCTDFFSPEYNTGVTISTHLRKDCLLQELQPSNSDNSMSYLTASFPSPPFYNSNVQYVIVIFCKIHPTGWVQVYIKDLPGQFLNYLLLPLPVYTLRNKDQ